MPTRDAIHIVIISRNDEYLINCLTSIRTELSNIQATGTLLLNGCTRHHEERALHYIEKNLLPIKAYRIPFGDKSNAINTYIYRLKHPADIHVFIDGYACVVRGSIAALTKSLKENLHSSGATGVPTGGRNAKLYLDQIEREGGLHGSLHALRDTFLERIRARGLAIPVGLYRGDGLLNSMAAFDLDPINNKWDKNRIAIVRNASWIVPRWKMITLKRMLRRLVNQRRGRWENAAIKELIKIGGFEGLPRCAKSMLLNYITSTPAETLHSRDLLDQAALRSVHTLQMPDEDKMQPQLLSGQLLQNERGRVLRI